MSSIIDAVKTRRSIRKYSSRRISTDVLNEILGSARWAPSAHNAQPWRFIVLTKKALKRDLAEAMANAWKVDMNKDNMPTEVRENLTKISVERFAHAPVIAVACLTMEDMIQYTDEFRQRFEHDLAAQSLGAAIQNVLLTAKAHGLGACWFGAPVFCKEAVRKILKIPEYVEPQALITMGYPAEKPRPLHKRPLENYSFTDYWGIKLGH